MKWGSFSKKLVLGAVAASAMSTVQASDWDLAGRLIQGIGNIIDQNIEESSRRDREAQEEADRKQKQKEREEQAQLQRERAKAAQQYQQEQQAREQRLEAMTPPQEYAGRIVIHKTQLGGGAKSAPVLDVTGHFARISPDGAWLAYINKDKGIVAISTVDYSERVLRPPSEYQVLRRFAGNGTLVLWTKVASGNTTRIETQLVDLQGRTLRVWSEGFPRLLRDQGRAAIQVTRYVNTEKGRRCSGEQYFDENGNDLGGGGCGRCGLLSRRAHRWARPAGIARANGINYALLR